MRLAILGSGSTGNVALVESAGEGGRPTRVLVDAGLPMGVIVERLAALDPPLALDDLDAVLVTHEHSDHVGCAAKLGLPIHAPNGTIRKKRLEGATRVLAGHGFSLGALEVMPVFLPHDAEETVGYLFTSAGLRIGILTDCGEPEDGVARAYAGCDVLVLEANHDRGLLALGPYPPSVQRRVRGPRGHLSNEQSAEMLRKILAHGPAPRVLIAAHRSLKNNTIELVERALLPLVPAGCTFMHGEPTGAPVVRLPVSSGSDGARPVRPRQLGLPFDLFLSAETP